MPNYTGRFTQSMYTQNFGGINARATVLNIGDNAAADITNFNIGIDGAIIRRNGSAIACTIGDYATPEIVFWKPFYDEDGIERFGAIAKNSTGALHWYDCDTPTGTYVDRGATGMTLDGSNSYKYVGANWKGAMLVANGTDQPIYAKYGQSVQTLKDASKLPDMSIVKTTRIPLAGAYSTTLKTVYGVTAVTARGETLLADSATYGWDFTNLTPSIYNLITWDPVAGATGYRIYFAFLYAPGAAPVRGFNPVAINTWYRIADVPGSETSWMDQTSTLPYPLKPICHFISEDH